MKYPELLLLLFSLLSALACNSEKASKAENRLMIYADYEVRYLEQEQELRALATFKQGDSLKNAVNRQFSNVAFQGSDMEVQNLGDLGYRYILSRKGPFSENLQFRFQNESGKELSYKLSMAPVGNFSIVEGKVQKSKGITIKWEGKALDASQRMIFMFTDKNQKAASTFIKGPTKNAEAFIPARDLSALTLGEGQLYLVKKQVLYHDEQEQSIQSVVELYTKAINIEVIE